MKTKTTEDPEKKKTRARDPLVAQRQARIRSEKEKIEKTIRAEYAVFGARAKLAAVKANAEEAIKAAEGALVKAEADLNALLNQTPEEKPEPEVE